MIIFNKNKLYVVDWLRASPEDGASVVINESPSVVEHNEILYVSNRSVSDIQLHLAGKNSPNYTPFSTIIEIYPDGSAVKISAVTNRDKTKTRSDAFDTDEFMVMGLGGGVLAASYKLFDGDIQAALDHSRPLVNCLKEGMTVSVYDLPQQKLKRVKPTQQFKLG